MCNTFEFYTYHLRSNSLGETALHHAYLYRDFKLAAFLETFGADISIKNNSGKTAAEVGEDYADTRGVAASKKTITLKARE